MQTYKQPFKISETPEMLDCEASSESTIDKLPTPQHAAEALHTFHISVFILYQDTFVVLR